MHMNEGQRGPAGKEGNFGHGRARALTRGFAGTRVWPGVGGAGSHPHVGILKPQGAPESPRSWLGCRLTPRHRDVRVRPSLLHVKQLPMILTPVVPPVVTP